MDTEINTVLDSLGGTTKQEILAEPNSHYSPGTTTSVEERALSLLGSGIAVISVAAALGVTESRISQLLSNKIFASQVATLRYKTLQSHNVRDGRYDTLEDRLLKRLENSLPLLIRPEAVLKAITIVNGAKRRGQSSPEQIISQDNVVNIILPNVIIEKFTVSVNNQVVKAGDQELLTMPSGNLLKQVEDAEVLRIEQEKDKYNVQEEGS